MSIFNNIQNKSLLFHVIGWLSTYTTSQKFLGHTYFSRNMIKKGIPFI
uniref:Uncharacterized protein n=1 Tax=Anguilla anguilla TaxID=7936 RepID=A0A0E9QXA3_ANGAN